MELFRLATVLLEVDLAIISLLCIVQFMRGRVAVVSYSMVILHMYTMTLWSYFSFPPGLPFEDATNLEVLLECMFMAGLAAAMIMENRRIPNQYYVIGMDEDSVYATMADMLLERKIPFEETTFEFLLKNPCQEVYTHKPSLLGAGTFVTVRMDREGKGKPSGMLPQFLSSIRGSFLNWRGRILLLLVILLSASLIFVMESLRYLQS
jgi:hypothetical protein